MPTPISGNSPRIVSFAISLILTLLIAPSVLAQIITASIQGTVTDANGAVVSGATVEVTKIDTNAVKNMNTDEDGRYNFQQLQPGDYKITVSKSGFAITEVEKITLTVGGNQTQNFELKISGVAERVVVEATQTVDTVKSGVSTTLNETAVSTTPILGRKFEDLLTLTPGVSVHFGHCCSRVPGDRIVGILDPDVGLTVHTIDCQRLADFADDGIIGNARKNG